MSDMNMVAEKAVVSVVRLMLGVLVMTMMLARVARSQEPPVLYTPDQVIGKAIDYHDPNGVWKSGRVRLGVHTTYSKAYAAKTGAVETHLTIVLAPGLEEFAYMKAAGDDRIEINVRQGTATVVVNGSTDVSAEDRERLRLREATMYRDYCEYLYLMPMKLRDPGTILDPHIQAVRFNDRIVWQLKVTYEPEVGKHLWYFFFDRDTFALIGYKFHFDESKNDGEYITFEGEIVDETSGLRLPKTRAWYYNVDDGHLATDDIVSISTLVDD
jgi:hypothetical protein